MFFCDNCRYENGWPEGWIKSQGRCEVCKRPALCSDIPSRFLFPPEPEVEPLPPIYYGD